MSEDETHPAECGYSTIHHLPIETTVRSRFPYGGEKPDLSQFESLYTPAETILKVTNPETAYRHAQGFYVNKVQDATHAVRSACPGDIIEVVHADGTQEFYFVDPVGFDELKFEQPTETISKQATGSRTAL